MVNPQEIIIKTLTGVLKQSGVKAKAINFEHPENEAYGDYATNIALTLGNKNPRRLAESIVEKLLVNKELKTCCKAVEAAGQGFINFKLTDSVLIEFLKDILKKGDQYGSSQEGRGKTVVIDYSAPNIAKRFSIGHLRSTIIGQAIYNLYHFCGWRTIGDNHLGDWGTQFGKMIVAVRRWANRDVDEFTIDELEKLYVKFHQEAEKKPKLEDEARQAFKALEDGSDAEKKIWQQLVDNSMEEFQRVYDLLGIKIDVVIGESFYRKIIPEVIKEAEEKGIAQRSQGALIINYPEDKLPPAMLLKSDGATTYLTRDLATIKYRQKRWHPDLIIYEVGAEQSLYFKQVFWTAELLGWLKRESLIHVPHGLVTLKESRMSTREGKTIKLEEVLSEAIKKAGKFNREPKVAKTVGIGAVKYNDLKRSPQSGYVFNWKEMLNLQGNSGPYLQYTYARCRSVIKKSKIKMQSASGRKKLQFKIQNYQFNLEELAILRKIYRFPEVVLAAGEQFNPSLICTFLYDLAQRYNTFYNKHSILQAESESQKTFRLMLTGAVSQVLKNGLTFLSIGVLEKM